MRNVPARLDSAFAPVIEQPAVTSLESLLPQGTTELEREYEIYGTMRNMAELDKAASFEMQEQWGLYIEKTEKNATAGNIRVRMTQVGNDVAEYTLTTKTKAKEGNNETELTASVDMFEHFKRLAEGGLRKRRYFFPFPEEGVTLEVDVFFTAAGTMCPKVKIDLELGKGIDPAVVGKIQMPFELDDVRIIPPGQKSDEDLAYVRELFRTYYDIPNQYREAAVSQEDAGVRVDGEPESQPALPAVAHSNADNTHNAELYNIKHEMVELTDGSFQPHQNWVSMEGLFGSNAPKLTDSQLKNPWTVKKALEKSYLSGSWLSKQSFKSGTYTAEKANFTTDAVLKQIEAAGNALDHFSDEMTRKVETLCKAFRSGWKDPAKVAKWMEQLKEVEYLETTGSHSQKHVRKILIDIPAFPKAPEIAAVKGSVEYVGGSGGAKMVATRLVKLLECSITQPAYQWDYGIFDTVGDDFIFGDGDESQMPDKIKAAKIDHEKDALRVLKAIQETIHEVEYQFKRNPEAAKALGYFHSSVQELWRQLTKSTK